MASASEVGSQSQQSCKVIRAYNDKWGSKMFEEKKGTSRGWVFTINNPTEDDCKAILALKDDKQVEYVCWQAERGEEKGTTHFQGWARTESIKLFTFRQKIGGRCWAAYKRGTAKECEDYCTKPGAIDGPWRIGTYRDDDEKKGPSQIQRIAEEILIGKDDKEIAEYNPTGYMLHYRKIAALREVTSTRINPVKRAWCSVIRVADEEEVMQIMEEEKWDGIYLKDATQWWQGYDGEKTVMMHSEPNPMWIRGYPFRIEVKGGGKMITCPERYFIIDLKENKDKKSAKLCKASDREVVKSVFAKWDGNWRDF